MFRSNRTFPGLILLLASFLAATNAHAQTKTHAPETHVGGVREPLPPRAKRAEIPKSMREVLERDGVRDIEHDPRVMNFRNQYVEMPDGQGGHILTPRRYAARVAAELPLMTPEEMAHWKPIIEDYASYEVDRITNGAGSIGKPRSAWDYSTDRMGMFAEALDGARREVVTREIMMRQNRVDTNDPAERSRWSLGPGARITDGSVGSFNKDFTRNFQFIPIEERKALVDGVRAADKAAKDARVRKYQFMDQGKVIPGKEAEYAQADHDRVIALRNAVALRREMENRADIAASSGKTPTTLTDEEVLNINDLTDDTALEVAKKIDGQYPRSPGRENLVDGLEEKLRLALLSLPPDKRPFKSQELYDLYMRAHGAEAEYEKLKILQLRQDGMRSDGSTPRGQNRVSASDVSRANDEYKQKFTDYYNEVKQLLSTTEAARMAADKTAATSILRSSAKAGAQGLRSPSAAPVESKGSTTTRPAR